MAAVAEKQTKRWTYEEYYRLDDDQRYEIIDGELLLMAPAPDTWHQEWVNELTVIVTPFVKKNGLGKVFVASVDVVLDSVNTVQPDLVFVSKANLAIVQRRAIFGTPDLVVEILSPSSGRRGRAVKQGLYARFGVKEYWIADPAKRRLEVLILKEGKYELHGAADQDGRVSSIVLAGLEFPLSAIA